MPSRRTIPSVLKPFHYITIPSQKKYQRLFRATSSLCCSNDVFRLFLRDNLRQAPIVNRLIEADFIGIFSVIFFPVLTYFKIEIFVMWCSLDTSMQQRVRAGIWYKLYCWNFDSTCALIRHACYIYEL